MIRSFNLCATTGTQIVKEENHRDGVCTEFIFEEGTRSHDNGVV
jgi:hypothetical protein